MIDLDLLRNMGVDTDTGMAYCADDPEFYEEMLAEFAEDGLIRSGDMARFMEALDWDNYAICAHSVKSSARMIGAAAISEQARVLEQAARAGDGAAVRTAHYGFAEEYRRLINAIRN